MTLSIGIGFGTTEAGISAPLAPSDLSATAVSSIQINLSWADNSANELSFHVERTLFGLASWSEIDSTSANISVYQDASVSNGIAYEYRVRAFNEAGYSSYSNTATATATAQTYSIGTVALPQEEYTPDRLDYSTWQTYYLSSDGTRNDDSTPADYTTFQTALDAAENYRSLNDDNVVIKIKNSTVLLLTAYAYIRTNSIGSTKWIYLVPEDASFLPSSGTKIRTGTYGETTNFTTSEMPIVRLKKLGSSTHTLIFAEDSADYYRFIGFKIEVDPADATITTGTHMVKMYSTATLVNQSTHWVFDQMWLYSGYNKAIRGIWVGGPYFYVTGTDIHCIATVTQGQAIWTFNSPGPCTVEDTTLACDSMNWMSGGADPTDEAHMPTDWTFRRVWSIKPKSWYDSGNPYQVLNHYEVKECKRLLIEDCVMENMWEDTQRVPFNFKSVNQSGGAQVPGISEDLTVRNCLVYNSCAAWGLAASPEEPVIRELQRVAFLNVGYVKHGNDSDFGDASSNGNILGDPDSELKNIYFDHITCPGQVPTAGRSVLLDGCDTAGGPDVQMTNSLFGYDLLVASGSGSNADFLQTLFAGDDDPNLVNTDVAYQSTRVGIWPNIATSDVTTISSEVQGKGVDAETLVADGSNLGANFTTIASLTAGVRSTGDLL